MSNYDYNVFLSACSCLDLRTIRDYVECRDLRVNDAADDVNQTGIHYVVGSATRDTERQIQVLKYLIRRGGADINISRTTDGWTPIFLAVTFGHTQIVTFLLARGAKTNVVDRDGLSIEGLAEKYRHRNIKDLLLHHRSRVPHSRFSCVQSGPALLCTTSTTTTTTTTTKTSSSSTTDSATTSSNTTSSSTTTATTTSATSESCGNMLKA